MEKKLRVAKQRIGQTEDRYKNYSSRRTGKKISTYSVAFVNDVQQSHMHVIQVPEQDKTGNGTGEELVN